MFKKIKSFLLTIIFCTVPGFYFGWVAREKLSAPIDMVSKYLK